MGGSLQNSLDPVSRLAATSLLNFWKYLLWDITTVQSRLINVIPFKNPFYAKFFGVFSFLHCVCYSFYCSFWSETEKSLSNSAGFKMKTNKCLPKFNPVCPILNIPLLKTYYTFGSVSQLNKHTQFISHSQELYWTGHRSRSLST